MTEDNQYLFDGRSTRGKAGDADKALARSSNARIYPWVTLSVAQGNTIQIGGLVTAGLLARYAARRAQRGSGWLLVSRLVAYFCEHAFFHWAVGWLGGIRFTGYGLHGSSHAHLYPPGMRWVFAHLPFLSARLDRASRRAASPMAQAAMYAAGPVATVLINEAILGYGWRRGIPHARGFLIGSRVWMLAMLLGESFRPHGDLRRAWHALRKST